MPEPSSALPGVAGMTGLDTNILLRAFVSDGDPHESAAIDLLRNLSRERPGFIAQATLVEFYWTLRRAYRIPKAECLRIIHRLTASPVLEFDDGERVMRALILAEEGADFPDALIHTTFEQFQCGEAATFDRKAALRFGWRLVGAEGGADEGSTARK